MNARTVCSALLALLLLTMPFPQDGEKGAYNPVSSLAYCQNRPACLHEIGHSLDYHAGSISQSTRFWQALRMFLIVELRKEELSPQAARMLEFTYGYPDGREPVKRELYAFLFEWADGEQEQMPGSFRVFYDWELARFYKARLRAGVTLYAFGGPPWLP